MKKIQLSTTIGLLLSIAAIVCLVLKFQIPAGILAVVAYFAAMKDVSKYTGLYQFIIVFISSALIGLSHDFPLTGIPFITIACVLTAAGSILRIAFFRVFSYTGHSWFEPVMFVIALTVYAYGNFTGDHTWLGYTFPAPIIIFQSILAWGILKDKKQLLAANIGGYKMQIGKPAVEFELPDQDGNLVKLTQYKSIRHLLLVFVRGDWCPGCHMMLRTYEKNREKFAAKNILVMAIGPDPVGVNREMVEKLGLDFKVLADDKQKIAMEYGVQLDKYDNNFAEKYEEGIPLPASFLIDKGGIVQYVSRPDKVGEFLNPSLIFPILEKLN
ncbi:MAG: redoxin domain-containing protein [Bacteroidia bacterium]|nr:redoxin domain-containing protein [Bacteroidia bacterium]